MQYYRGPPTRTDFTGLCMSNFIQTPSDLAPILKWIVSKRRLYTDMSEMENSQTEASRHAAAIERWEDEGGASKAVLKHDRRKTITKPASSRGDWFRLMVRQRISARFRAGEIV